MQGFAFYVVAALLAIYIIITLLRRASNSNRKPSIKELMQEGSAESGISLEHAEKLVAETSSRDDYIIAAQFDGTKGVTMSFVLEIVSQLHERGINARFEHATGTSGLESGGFLMNIRVQPDQIQAAKMVLESLPKK